MIGFALLLYAQAALPGTWLYGVQKVSDAAVIRIDPSYRGTVMMHRANEVRQLVGHHAGTQTVLAALADYQVQMAAYKSAPASYAALEYCRSNLVQAAAVAPPAQRQAINRTLAAIGNIH